MRRSPDSLRRGIIINENAPLSARLQALKEVKPTRRFLEHLLKAEIPSRLHAEASRILLSLPEKARRVGRLLPVSPIEAQPHPSIERPAQTEAAEPVMTESFDSEGRRIIAADLWDLLTLAGTELYAPMPGCVRGPDPAPHPPCPEQTPEALAPHNWRDAGGEKNETTF
jgi:hypothetical protein